ncbi:MAG: tRNA (adenosine(37)-N6)-threonylcarbamoyltransferase complex dimerization subunit type 1 TsaB [Verrucomicrobiales bacterium]|nr:tRNA (adenosine(37)-N6)-threonylcarbamoyltransferase complex dimerization subunit type 1 TsaB [Verrucomicrobiales bacterium]
MTTLALEFSSDRRGVAVVRDQSVLSEVIHRGTRETPIFGLIERALGEARMAPDAIERIAVGLGPGSNTGVRLALSVAQGWQLGSEVDIVGVVSLESLAVMSAPLGTVTLAVDSQRNEWAVAEAAGGKLTGSIRLVGVELLRSWISSGQQVAGPDVVSALGGGVEIHPSAAVLGRWAMEAVPVPAEQLTPVYLREASFVKAPPGRDLAGLPSLNH